jgi:hypothetical protein
LFYVVSPYGRRLVKEQEISRKGRTGHIIDRWVPAVALAACPESSLANTALVNSRKALNPGLNRRDSNLEFRTSPLLTSFLPACSVVAGIRP